jgi:hypothetical protein
MEKKRPDIPVIKNCVLALHTDTKKQKDHILIGEFGEIRKILNGSDSARVIVDSKLPLGSFAADCMQSIPRTIADIRSALGMGETKSNPGSWNNVVDELTQLYNSSNLCFKFYALKIWQEYDSRQEQHFLRHKADSHTPFIDFVEDLTLPSRMSSESYIMDAQNSTFDEPLDYFENVFLDGTANFFYTNQNRLQEYVVADTDMMPVMIYSLNKIYKNHQYFQRCKVCHKLFLAHTANIPTLCSAKCRQEQSRRNKRRYDKVKKDISYEKNYKNNYMYWYNKLEKLKKADGIDYHPFEKAFQTFCLDAKTKKRAVKSGSYSVSDFNDWMLSQRTKADKITSQILKGRSHDKT